MANNLVRFVYIPTTATAEQIAAFDSDTLYFVNGTRQLYKGSVLYDGGAAAAAADLATLRAQIGTLPVDAAYEDLIDYIDKQIAAGDAAVEADLTALDNSLADVAKSGAAADVSIADTAGNLDATTVEGALAELADKVGDGADAAVVTVTKTMGGANDSFVAKYTFSQGGVAITNGEITIAKDMVATSGELVQPTAENPIVIDGNQVTSGTYIKMTIGNGEDFYINVADLIEYNAVDSTSEIVLTDTNHTITATVGEIAASKIVYREASGTPGEEGYVAKQTVAQAINALETAASTGVDNKIAAAIGTLDSTISATSGSVLTGLTIVDGLITGKTEIALTAGNVGYGASTVAAALDTIGVIPSTATATTVVGYVDEKATAAVAALDANVDAVLGVGDTDAEAIAVVTGVTEVDGVITGVDSAAADAAGAATRAKAEVIGQNGDATTANTIYGAKAYAADAVSTAVAALDANLDATGTAAHAGTFVVSGITQVDGQITAIDSVEVENAGAAAAAQAAAQAYTDSSLTWGSLA